MSKTSTTETATDEANRALVRGAYDAFSRAISSGRWPRQPRRPVARSGSGPLSRDYRGHAEVLGFFEHFMKLSGGTFQLQVNDVIARGDRVVILCTEALGAVAVPGPHLRFTSGSSRTERLRSSGSTRGDEQAEDEFWNSDA